MNTDMLDGYGFCRICNRLTYWSEGSECPPMADEVWDVARCEECGITETRVPDRETRP